MLYTQQTQHKTSSPPHLVSYNMAHYYNSLLCTHGHDHSSLQYEWETNRLALISLNNMQISNIYLFTHRRLSFTPPHLTSRPGSICFYHSVDTWLTPGKHHSYVL